MTLLRLSSVLWFLTLAASLSAQQTYPKDYFDSPLDRDIYLSGTFCELRSSHFHAGIDIKTINGRSGEKIFSSAGGHITRISVSPTGYGNALYISHPNGYTTVYCHLDQFTPEIANYVKAQQYSQKRFKVNLYPRPDQFQLKKGEHIGYLGNSGGSFGPHLHFEIRRTSDQVPINPFHFGIGITDDIPPTIDLLNVHFLDEGLTTFHTEEFNPVEVSPGKYVITDTIEAGAWRVGFSLRTVDRMNGVRNRNGIYQLEMLENAKGVFGFTMDEMSFAKSRYINAHIDFAASKSDKGMLHRCYKLPSNPLSLYTTSGEAGIVKIFAEKPVKVQIRCIDYNGNSSELVFYIKRADDVLVPSDNGEGVAAGPDISARIEKSGFLCVIPEGSLYESASIMYTKRDTTEAEIFAALHQIGHKTIGLHKYMDIELIPDRNMGELADKSFIARVEEDEMFNCGGKNSNGRLTASVRQFGTYSISIDTIAPEIQAVQYAQDMSTYSRMRFRITDNMPVSGKAKSLSYEASVDGKWILMEYDAKNDMLTHWFDERIAPGEHTLKITVRDDRGNINNYSSKFTR